MKTLKSFFAFIAIFSFIQVGQANIMTTNAASDATMLVQTVSKANNSVALRLVRNTSDKLIIHLKDATGTVHYYDRVNNQKDYYRDFLLQYMSDGDYHFEIRKSDATVIVKHFSLEGGVVTLINPNEVVSAITVNEAYTIQLNSTDNQSIALHFQNKTDQKVTLRLKDQTGKTLYFQKIKADESYTRRLILTEVPNGEYDLSIDGQKEIQTLFIKDGKVKLGRDIPKA
jgi:hypothetical protein